MPFIDNKNPFTSLSYLHYQHKYCDSKSNWPGILLLLPGNNLENTWKFVLLEKCKPCYLPHNNFYMAFTLFKIFNNYTYIIELNDYCEDDVQ